MRKGTFAMHHFEPSYFKLTSAQYTYHHYQRERERERERERDAHTFV